MKVKTSATNLFWPTNHPNDTKKSNHLKIVFKCRRPGREAVNLAPDFESGGKKEVYSLSQESRRDDRKKRRHKTGGYLSTNIHEWSTNFHE